MLKTIEGLNKLKLNIGNTERVEIREKVQSQKHGVCAND